MKRILTNKRKRAIRSSKQLPYTIVKGEIIFNTMPKRQYSIGDVEITEENLKELNMQRLIIRRSGHATKGALSKQLV